MTGDGASLFERAYPGTLREREQALLGQRGVREAPAGGLAGLGLSGGGIRSATFALGFCQALAQRSLLRQVDFLSTVSGGGYFGSFLGRLFSRPTVSGAEDVEGLLAPDAHLAPDPGDDEPAQRRKRALRSDSDDILGWLRDNGRYLAPRGAGDVMLGGAILVRNGIAVQVVMGSFLLLAFVAAQLIRGLVEVGAGAHWAAVNDFLGGTLPLLGVAVWASPYLLLAGAMLAAWAAPMGWAYWLVSSRRLRGNVSGLPPLWGALAAAAVAALLVILVPLHPAWQGALAVIVAIALLALVFWRLAAERVAGDPARQGEQERLDAYELESNRLSQWLAVALQASLGVLALAVIDSIGQTIYAALESPGGVIGWATGAAGVSATALLGARRLTVMLKPGGGERLKVPAAVLAYAAAGALGLVLLVTLDLLSQGVAWELKRPANVPATFMPVATPDPLYRSTELRVTPEAGGFRVHTGAAPVPGPVAPRFLRQGLASLRTPALAAAVLLVFSLLFGRTWEFLNRSSLLTLYGARLVRAYLGASNPRRMGPKGQVVTDPIAGDDVPQAGYWGPGFPGAPLHLVNVTVNETVDGRSQVVQQDRRGVGLAVGPAGFSAGVRHHLVRGEPATVFPTGGYQMFSASTAPEELSLGHWVGISGAAFSTGLGSRTNLGLSLLAGVGNLRLGYWWNSGGAATAAGGVAHRALLALFPVQSYFLDEFTAHFRGSAQAHWYLTDGGHFENMAGYELIRRRLPVIVIVDAEEDPAYAFAGLANLVRKARTDFDARIEFLDERQLAGTLPEALVPQFGPLRKLRRGIWSEEPVLDPAALPAQKKRLHVDAANEGRYSLAHAALARVFYDGSDEADSWLLYVKTALTGDEPADLLQYHGAHPAFPHESTADQFFDEAQWESYRALGQHVGACIFDYEAQAADIDRVVPSALLRSGERPRGRHRPR